MSRRRPAVAPHGERRIPPIPRDRIHPTAIIELGVRLGPRTVVWDHVHIRRGAQIGRDCLIGEKTYIAYDVRIGDLVKINAFVYLCAGVVIEDRVMVSAGVVFTNDKFPRAVLSEEGGLVPSGPPADMPRTIVRTGATVGANATIGAGVELGTYCLIGMGAVVTRDVQPFQLVVGCPARPAGWVCVCGTVMGKIGPPEPMACGCCDRSYALSQGVLFRDKGGVGR